MEMEVEMSMDEGVRGDEDMGEEDDIDDGNDTMD